MNTIANSASWDSHFKGFGVVAGCTTPSFGDFISVIGRILHNQDQALIESERLRVADRTEKVCAIRKGLSEINPKKGKLTEYSRYLQILPLQSH